MDLEIGDPIFSGALLSEGEKKKTQVLLREFQNKGGHLIYNPMLDVLKYKDSWEDKSQPAWPKIILNDLLRYIFLA